eukprot:scaffold21_cov90-Isochrysis_galbana.AAC.6
MKRKRNGWVGRSWPHLLHVAEVHVEGIEARPPRRSGRRVLVVVPLIELARLVAQDLQVLGILLWHAGQVLDAAADAGQKRVRPATR